MAQVPRAENGVRVTVPKTSHTFIYGVTGLVWVRSQIDPFLSSQC